LKKGLHFECFSFDNMNILILFDFGWNSLNHDLNIFLLVHRTFRKIWKRGQRNRRHPKNEEKQKKDKVEKNTERKKVFFFPA
jgi:hypothetical protein